jgi:hypothetical protein
VHHAGGRRAGKFDGEVPVADRIKAVATGAVKAELSRGHVPVDGEGGAREGGRAQGQPVHALATADEP